MLGFQLAQLLLQRADPFVGGIGLEGVAHLDVQQRGLASAFGRDLQGVRLQRDRQVLKHQFMFACRQFAAGGPGHHGAVLIDRHRANGRSQPGGRAQAGNRCDGQGQKSTSH
ncbi:hypothetical protein D3C72_1863610 [compost metagenome]